jgi:hypothetical protein
LAGAAPRSGPSAPKRPLANPNGSAVPDPSTLAVWPNS